MAVTAASTVGFNNLFIGFYNGCEPGSAAPSADDTLTLATAQSKPDADDDFHTESTGYTHRAAHSFLTDRPPAAQLLRNLGCRLAGPGVESMGVNLTPTSTR
jgi:hypothetical protein